MKSLKKTFNCVVNIAKEDYIKDLLFFIFINIFFIFLFFPNIFDKGFMFFSDNPSIISWNYFLNTNLLSLWRDQSSMGVNDFTLILYRPLIFLFGFLNLILNNEIINRLQVISPIFVLNLSSFILFRDIFKFVRFKYFYIFIFSSFFQVSSIWIGNIYGGFILPSLSLAFLPVIIYAVYKKNIKLFLLLSLTIPFSTLPGAFIFLIFYLLLALLFYEKNKIRNIMLVILLNIWWILSVVVSFFSKTVVSNEYLNDYSSNILNYFISSKFTESFLGNASWNSFISFGATENLVFFMKYSFTFLNLLFLILVILFFIFRHKYYTDFIKKLFILFFIFLSASIFIRYVPILNVIFKSTGRFLWISDFLIIIMFGFLISKSSIEKNMKKYTINIFLLVVLLFSLFNFIELRKYNLKPISLPPEYSEFLPKYSKNNYRTLFLPSKRNWYLEANYNNKYNGGYLGIIDPLQYSVTESLTFFSMFEPYTDLYLKNKVFDQNFESLVFLDELKINLVVFHNYAVKDENDASPNIIYLLKENKAWSCVDNSALTVCERIDKLSTINVGNTNVVFKKIYSGKFSINVKNIFNENNVNFFESFHNGWKLYLNKYHGNELCGENNDILKKLRNKLSINTECQPLGKMFEGEELSYLYKKPIFDNTHQLVYDYANKWTIDPDYIKQNFSKEYYKENPDGSIDIELTLYFKPQSYFYLGLIISGTTLLGCLGYLGWDFIKRKKKKI